MSFYSEEVAKQIYEKRKWDIDYYTILMVVNDAIHLYNRKLMEERHKECETRGFER